MLKLKNKHHLDFSYVVERVKPSHKLELAPVPVDDDELAQAIDNDPVVHDDRWELSERPDAAELTKFWEDVVTEVKQDPEWTFEDD
jgi:hypothetical protein